MQSPQPFARRAALAPIVLLSLLASSWGAARAAPPASAKNDNVLPPPEHLELQKPVEPTLFSHATPFTFSLPWRVQAPASPAQFDCTNVTEIPQAECEALVALYESTDGDNWTDNTGWLTTNTPCSWFGVTCSTGNISQLHFWQNNLYGVIPSEIGNLSALTSLNLGINQLSGPIPPELGNLAALKSLNLHWNKLSGHIPPNIGDLTTLTSLNLSGNILSGSIPPEIGNLTALTRLDLSGNPLSGPIPPEIGNLTALTRLDLTGNPLSGPIPPEFGVLAKLTDLNLGWKQLSRSIPSEIGNLSALTQIDLSFNQFSGTIPSEIGNLSALVWLNLSGNQLSGPIPPELGNLTALTYLSLERNQLSGPIPPELGNLAALTSLGLSSNQLSGAIPPEIGNLAALRELSLGGNQLSGPIPPEIGNLTALTGLNLGFNGLSGSIPPEIGNLTALTELKLIWNQLSGPIPPEIGNLIELGSLDLSGNQLSGPIPPEIGDLTVLQELWLFNNQLSGSLPPEIGDLSALEMLWLNNNQLSGPIPLEIGNLSALYWLALSSNQLSGPILPEIGDLTALRWLYLHNNSFSGEVPAALTSLTLDYFTFYNTDLCIPAEDHFPIWLSGIPTLYGTGLICGEGLGSLGGTVTLTDATPVANVQVNLYRSIPQWDRGYLTTTYTSADGAYHFTSLGQGLGIDYRVQFVDLTRQLASQYYDAKPNIDTADAITITPGVPRTGINAVLALPQPPAVDVGTDTGSVVYNFDGTAQITIPEPNPSDITISRVVTCAAGTPTTVILHFFEGDTLLGPQFQFPMENVDGDLYRTTIPAAALPRNAAFNIAAVCDGLMSSMTVGYVTLYTPNGIVSDHRTGLLIANATVTLHYVPGWEPKTAPDDDRPNTCESNLSKSPDDPWSQPAPTNLGIISNFDIIPTAPRLPYQHTTADGYYGWDVSEGCWYVTVEAEGYWPLTSPVVGVPPEVTDLDLALIPTSCPTPLTNVGILGPLNVTTTLYINTLYTFRAVITPTDATPPITYTWSPAPQTGQGTDTATYRWNVPEMYTVTLTAQNCGGVFEATREFIIEAQDMFTVYLPLVLRNQ